MPGFPVLHYLPEFAQTHVHRVGDAIQPSNPLLSPSLPAFDLSQHQGLFISGGPSIELLSSSNEYSGLIYFRIDLFDLPAVQGTFKSLLSSPTPQFRSVSSSVLSLLYGPTLTSIQGYWKNHSFD